MWVSALPTAPAASPGGRYRSPEPNLPGGRSNSRVGTGHAEGVQDEIHLTPQVAGILLTGGESRRMGFDKATVSIDGVPSAERIARLLRDVVTLAFEVGPGVSGLPAVSEQHPGSGPLVAMCAGARALRHARHGGPALVLACDLPLVTDAVLRTLANWPGDGSVVPVLDGNPQPLCARWSAEDLAATAGLVDVGRRAVKALLERPGVTLLDEASWPEDMEATAFTDVDTPHDLDRLGLPWRPGPPITGRARS